MTGGMSMVNISRHIVLCVGSSKLALQNLSKSQDFSPENIH